MEQFRHIFSHPIVLILFILFFASVLRFYNLSGLPSGFHNDEASFLYNAVSLKETGHDEDGRLLPLYLRSYIDPKPALFSYLQIPFVSLLGPTHTAARLPSVIFGVISIYLFYLLLRKLTNEQTALIGSFLLAISPWHILLSRASQEVILSFVFTLGAVLTLLVFLSEKRFHIGSFFLFSVCTLLSLYSYHSAKVFLPIMIIGIIGISVRQQKISLKHILSPIFIVVCSLGITLILGGTTRYNAVSIFNDPQTQLLIDEKIRTASFSAPYLAIRIFDNKFVEYAWSLLNNYGSYFTTTFLFLSGGQPERYIIPFHGLLYAFETVLLLIGLIIGFRETSYKKASLLFLLWLFIAPLPGTLTSQEVPSIIRAFVMVIPLMYFISLGILKIWNYRENSYLRFLGRGILILSYVAGISYFFFQFSIQQPYYHPWRRNYAEELLPTEIGKVEKNYQHIYVSGNQYIYFALAGMIPLRDVQTSYPKRTEYSQWGHISFKDSNCYTRPIEHVLFVIKGNCDLGQIEISNNFIIRETIYFKDTNPAYKLLEYHPGIKKLSLSL